MAEPVAESVDMGTSIALRPYVRSIHGYRYEGFTPGLHRGLPSGDLTFIISLSEPIELLVQPDRRRPSMSSRAFVSGLHAHHALIGHDGNQYGISLQLTPAGARALFGVPARALAYEVVDLETLAGAPARDLVDRLPELDWPGRAEAFDSFLHSRLDDHRAGRPELSWAWQHLERHDGAADMSDVAHAVGWNRHHLARRFHEEFGLGPKLTSRIMRFGRSKSMLAGGGARLADIAVRCGYYDQAHMARDWREFAGCSPSAWAEEEELPLLTPADATIVA
jgi:AraC-like DNA-binding protein